MGHLNLISLLGIFVMIAMAWLVSSHRTKVNWRLVILGILLQAVLAGVLFQSQNWTFDQSFGNFSEVIAAVEAQELEITAVDSYLESQQVDSSYSNLLKDFKDGTKTQSEIDGLLGTITISKYPQGILFSGVNAFFAAVNNYVREGSMFVFRFNAIPQGNPTDPTAPVPLPAGLPLLLAGLGALGIAKRRKG